MNNEYSIHDNFSNINFSSYTNNLISGVISGVSLNGNINSVYIGSGDPANFVTNQEFSYLTGVTSNVQTQINSKTDNFQNYLTYSAVNSTLINSYNIVPGLNITANTDNNHYLLNIKINSLTWGQIYDQTSGDVNSHLIKYCPAGWSDGYPNNATEILINPQRLLILQSISGQSDGRICKITNVGKYPIIIQNNFYVTTSDSVFRILFSRRGDYILRPNSSVSFIYTIASLGGWICMDDIKNNGFDYQDGFASISSDFNANQFTNAISWVVGLPVSTNNFIISAHTSNIPNLTTGKMLLYSYGKTSVFYLNNFNENIANKFWGIGQFGNNQLLNYEKKLYVYQSIFGRDNGNRGTSTAPALSFGFQNTYNLYGYSAATNSFTSLPNLGGGIFFISDTGYSNNFIYLVQTNDGSSITGQTNFSTLNTSIILGMSILTSSGNSLGETTFYTKNVTTGQYSVFNPIQHTGTTLTSYPSFYIYPNRDVSSTNIALYSYFQKVNSVSIDNISFLEHTFI